MKTIKNAKIREEMKDMEASLRRAKLEASLADGITWGMDEDAIEENEVCKIHNFLFVGCKNLGKFCLLWQWNFWLLTNLQILLIYTFLDITCISSCLVQSKYHISTRNALGLIRRWVLLDT